MISMNKKMPAGKMMAPENIQSDFPILGQKIYGRPLVYLDNAATTHKPQAVLDRIVSFYTQENSNIHRGVHFLSEAASEAYENARHAVQHFIHAASAEEIIFTSGTTGAINLLADSFAHAFINPGDEIIISEMEHHSNLVPWQVVCLRRGARLKVLPMGPDGGLLIEKLSELITERTKLIACAHVSNALGIVNPIREIVETAHQANIPVLVDAAQSAARLPIDVQALDCDFLVFSGHKIYAETGIGVLYGKEKYLEAMPPYQTGGGMIDRVRFDETTFADLPLKFEAGTPNIAGAVSVAAAIEYIQGIGFDAITDYEHDLLDYALRQLSQIEGLTVYGNLMPRCGVVSFNIEGVHHYDVGVLLDKLGIAIRTGMHCAEPVMRHFGITGTIRASFALYNTPEDIDMLVNGIGRAKAMLV
ncbi:MAG: cysteine desulfurase [Desulfobacterales bacterium]|nr:cysteine desulfurase [Desulfobacterales bacterium]